VVLCPPRVPGAETLCGLFCDLCPPTAADAAALCGLLAPEFCLHA